MASACCICGSKLKREYQPGQQVRCANCANQAIKRVPPTKPAK